LNLMIVERRRLTGFAGWVVGNHDSEGALNLSLCVKSKIAVISVNYLQYVLKLWIYGIIIFCTVLITFFRAPEFVYPVRFNDSWDVLKLVAKSLPDFFLNKQS
jgi:acetyl esterase/lipase